LLMRPAAKLYYTVAGRTVLIEAHDEWAVLAVEELFSGWFLDSISKADTVVPDAIVEVHCGESPPALPTNLASFEIALGGTCHTDTRIFYIELDGSWVVFEGDSPKVELWVKGPYEFSSPSVAQLLSHALSPALRRCHVFEIHSAGVVSPGIDEAVLIAGPSGSGKSTLTSLLAGCGWSYLSDDILLLREVEHEIEASPFRRFFALTPTTIAATNIQSSHFNRTTKERIAPQEHFSSAQVQSAKPSAIFFSSVAHEQASRVLPLTARESMTRLLRLCPWASYDKPTSVAHLRVLGMLANSTQAFELHAGADLLERRGRADELVHSVFPQTASSYVT
jgi:hypothetical protein